MNIIQTTPDDPDAILLIEELSQTLEQITGSTGRNSFNPDDVSVPNSLFVIAYDELGIAAGCGAIRPISNDIAEVKRMYAKTKARGIGSEILQYLEAQAKELGYSVLWLETRIINTQAVAFYEKNGYCRIPNYGKYAGRPEAVCFEKKVL